MQIVSSSIATPDKKLKMSTKTVHTIKTNDTNMHNVHQNPQKIQSKVNKKLQYQQKDEKIYQKKVQQRSKSYISMTSKNRKASMQKTKFADSHLSEHPYQQQNQEPVQRKFFNLQLNCNFFDFKSDLYDTALPKRVRKMEKIQQNSAESKTNEYAQIEKFQFITAHNIPLQQSILIKSNSLIHQNDNFSDKTLTNVKTPINQLKFQESEDQDLMKDEVFQTGMQKISISRKNQASQTNHIKIGLNAQKIRIGKKLALFCSSQN